MFEKCQSTAGCISERTSCLLASLSPPWLIRKQSGIGRVARKSGAASRAVGQFVYDVVEGSMRRRETLESDELEQERNTYRYASLNTAEGMLRKSGLNLLMRSHVTH